MEEKKTLFGKGIYGKKDAPIKVLDCFIGGAILLIIVFVVSFALNGGFIITFDTDGGSEVTFQKIGYGDFVEEPTGVTKPGYELNGWMTSDDETLAEVWEFSVDTVTSDMTLVASWTPASITVKFDLDGGNVNGIESIDGIMVTYGEIYGELPVVDKEGYVFDYWIYSGNVIDGSTVVEATGEHVLTACWIEE